MKYIDSFPLFILSWIRPTFWVWNNFWWNRNYDFDIYIFCLSTRNAIECSRKRVVHKMYITIPMQKVIIECSYSESSQRNLFEIIWKWSRTKAVARQICNPIQVMCATDKLSWMKKNTKLGYAMQCDRNTSQN